MLDEQQRECCDLCAEPVGGDRADVGGKWICPDCAEEIVAQARREAEREVRAFVTATVEAAQRAAMARWRRRLELLSMN